MHTHGRSQWLRGGGRWSSGQDPRYHVVWDACGWAPVWPRADTHTGSVCAWGPTWAGSSHLWRRAVVVLLGSVSGSRSPSEAGAGGAEAEPVPGQGPRVARGGGWTARPGVRGFDDGLTLTRPRPRRRRQEVKTFAHKLSCLPPYIDLFILPPDLDYHCCCLGWEGGAGTVGCGPPRRSRSGCGQWAARTPTTAHGRPGVGPVEQGPGGAGVGPGGQRAPALGPPRGRGSPAPGCRLRHPRHAQPGARHR